MKTWLGLGIAIFLVIADQALKRFLVTYDILYTTKIGTVGVWYNPDAVFSVPLPYYLTIVVSLFTLICLLYGWYYFTSINLIGDKWLQGGLVLLIAGGVSNIIDRVFVNAVIDILAVDSVGIHLNMADIYIIVGSILLLIFLHTKHRREVVE